MAYSALAMLPPTTKYSQEELVKNLKQMFNKLGEEVKVLDEKRVSVRVKDWELHIYFDDSYYVREECREIAETIAKNHENKNIIAACVSWYAVSSDDDPDMEFFNHYVWALDVLAKFEGIILFDNGRFI